MRSSFILLLCLFSSYFAKAQTGEKDLKFIDSISKDYTTYDVKLFINDRPVFNNIPVRQRLENHFSFLKQKKLSVENPEMVFTVNINTAILEQPKFSVRKVDINTPNEGNLYRYQVQYSFNANIEVRHNEEGLYNIVIPTKDLYTTTETTVYKDAAKNAYPADTHLQMFLNNYTLNFPFQDQLFLSEFYPFFKDYTKGRLPK
jgi:hypothetical protein